MFIRRILLLSVLGLLCVATGARAGALKIVLVDDLDETRGSAVIKLDKGTVKVKATLAPLPATIDTGEGTFEATMYRAYLVNGDDEALEISLGSVYPTTKGTATVKAKFKGDLSQLGLDGIVIVAFSKDGLHSHDVLTGTIDIP